MRTKCAAEFHFCATPGMNAEEPLESLLTVLIVDRVPVMGICNEPNPRSNPKNQKEYFCSIQNAGGRSDGSSNRIRPIFTAISIYGHEFVLSSPSSNETFMSIPVTDLSAKQVNSTSFKISGNIDLLCKASTYQLCDSWVRLFKSLNRAQSIFPQTAYKPNELPIDILQKRCYLASTTITGNTFKGGELVDIIKFIIIHCSEPLSDNVQLTGLLIYINEYDLFDELVKSFESVSSFYVPDRHLTQTETTNSLRSRLQYFAEQLCRAYSMFTPEQRNRFLDNCSEFIVESQDSLRALANVRKTSVELLKIHALSVQPQWGTQQLDLLEISPSKIAKQLTYFEAKLHKQLEFQGLVENEGFSLTSFVCWWNRIAAWTSSCILCEKTDKSKKSMLAVFLRIADKLLKLRNYSSFAQIISGLKHHSIERLVGLKELLNAKMIRKLEYFESLISPNNNYAAYRNLPKTSPCLRFLAVHQRDIRFIWDSNEMFLDEDKKIINAERILLMGEVANEIGLVYPEHSFNYPINAVEKYQDFLSQIKSVSDEDLFTLSFACESNRAEEVLAAAKVVDRKASNPLHNSAKLNRLYKSIEKNEKDSFRNSQSFYTNSDSLFPKLKRSQTEFPAVSAKRESDPQAITIRSNGKCRSSSLATLKPMESPPRRKRKTLSNSFRTLKKTPGSLVNSIRDRID